MPSASVDNVLSGGENLMTEKFHSYLNAGLLLEDALSSRLNLVALPKLARGMLESSERQGRQHGR